MRSAKPQEEENYVSLMIAHQMDLRAFIYSLLPGSPDVDDVLQNTNAVLWQKRAQFKAGTNFLAWAFKIARYQVKHQHGRIKRDGRLVFSEDLVNFIADTSDQDNSSDGLLTALEGCLSKLADEQREIVNQRYTLGCSLEQHAKALGRSAGSLRIALHRIRETLRQCVENALANPS